MTTRNICGLVGLALLFSSYGCNTAELQREATAHVRVFEANETIPEHFVAIGEVRSSREYPSLRADVQEIIDSLVLRAYKKGADAIGEIDIKQTTQDKFAQTPRSLTLSGAATTYKNRMEK